MNEEMAEIVSDINEAIRAQNFVELRIVVPGADDNEEVGYQVTKVFYSTGTYFATINHLSQLPVNERQVRAMYEQVNDH
jgi:hypothetical protein